ncbi:MAG: S8 family serine peptidase [Bacteroidales bacterium]|nr:S8 family serine peptidase [Bacteroidales bacterium]
MKRTIAILLFFGMVFCGAAQPTTTVKFMVSFSDKDNSPFSLNMPGQFLSQRAIDRRVRQGLVVDVSDLPVNPNYIDSIKQQGVTVLHTSRWLNAALVETDDSLKVFDLLGISCVSDVSMLFYQKSFKNGKKEGTKSIENGLSIDVLASEELLHGALANTSNNINYGQGFAQANMIAVNYLHQLGYKGDSMLIAVLDAGFNSANTLTVFDSLYAEGRVLAEIDLIEKGGDIYTGSTHGMAVLSTMAANQPGILVGTAPKASYLLIRTEDISSEFPVEEFNWVVGAEFADSAGADMINSSLGYTTFDDTSLNYTYSDMNGRHALSSRGATMAARKGMLVVASAGNSGNSPWKYISAPGDADSILTIGAVNVAGDYASFSSTGPTYDQRIKPNVVAMGEGTYVANTYGSVGPGNGTSFSSPVLCGAVACLWQANKTKSNMRIAEMVERSASQYTFPDSLKGYGIPNLAVAHLLLNEKVMPDIVIHSEVDVFPNPFNNSFVVGFFSTDTDKVIIEIVDMNGKHIRAEEHKMIGGYNYIEISGLSDLKSGIHLMRLLYKEREITKKLIKK